MPQVGLLPVGPGRHGLPAAGQEPPPVRKAGRRAGRFCWAALALRSAARWWNSFLGARAASVRKLRHCPSPVPPPAHLLLPLRTPHGLGLAGAPGDTVACAEPGAPPVPAPGLSVWDRGVAWPSRRAQVPPWYSRHRCLSQVTRVCPVGTVRPGQGRGRARARVEALPLPGNLSGAPRAHTRLCPKPVLSRLPGSQSS